MQKKQHIDGILDEIEKEIEEEDNVNKPTDKQPTS
jgi:hypothetical protein